MPACSLYGGNYRILLCALVYSILLFSSILFIRSNFYELWSSFSWSDELLYHKLTYSLHFTTLDSYAAWCLGLVVFFCRRLRVEWVELVWMQLRSLGRKFSFFLLSSAGMLGNWMGLMITRKTSVFEKVVWASVMN